MIQHSFSLFGAWFLIKKSLNNRALACNICKMPLPPSIGIFWAAEKQAIFYFSRNPLTNLIVLTKKSLHNTRVTCSWYQKTNSPILPLTNLKCWIKAKEPFKTPFYWCISSYLLLQKHLKPCFFEIKDILQHFKFANWWIGVMENCFFDVANRGIIMQQKF